MDEHIIYVHKIIMDVRLTFINEDCLDFLRDAKSSVLPSALLYHGTSDS